MGDDDQSIYSWRGAEVENILRFEKDFVGSRVVRLESNYRSTAPILAAASALIAHNGGRLGKTLRSGRNDSAGEKLRVASVWDSEEEARLVGERIEKLQREGDSLAQMAVLVRAGFQTRAFEERLIQLGLPYRVIGGLRFYERAEIRDADRLYARARTRRRRPGVRAHRQHFRAAAWAMRRLANIHAARARGRRADDRGGRPAARRGCAEGPNARARSPR